MLFEWPQQVRRIGVTPWVLLAAAMWLGLVATWVTTRPASADLATLCWFKNLTGVPCPTCGTTRAVLAMRHGNFGAAMQNNPFFVAVILAITVWIMHALWSGKWRAPIFPARRRAIIWTTLLVLFLANWVYLIASGR